MTIDQRLTPLFAKCSTRALIDALVKLDAQSHSPERNWSRAMTIEELERRYPEASAVVEAASEDLDAYFDYVTALVNAIERLGVR